MPASRSPGSSKGAFNYACALEISPKRRAGAETVHGSAGAVLRRAVGFVGLGDSGGIADCLDGLARLAADTGDGRARRSARRRCGAASRCHVAGGRYGLPTPLRELPATALAAGREMTVDEAVAYALVAAG